jgi:predicted CoA-binding protein
VNELRDVLRSARTVVVVDYPTEDVPIELARTGLTTIVHGGPEPENYTQYQRVGDEVVTSYLGRQPSEADIVYVYRPVDELAGIAAFARELGARALWVQHEPSAAPDAPARAREIAHEVGLILVDDGDIVDAAREFSS